MSSPPGVTPREWVAALETALLRHDVGFFDAQAAHFDAAPPATIELVQAGQDMLAGKIEAAQCNALGRYLVKALLAVTTPAELLALDLASATSAAVGTFLAGASDPAVAQAQVLVFAIACLHEFVSQNYTGPPNESMQLIAHWSDELKAGVNEWASNKLRLDGEDVFEHAHHPLSLLLARVLFMQCGFAERLPALKSVSWWSMRYARVHQDLLEQNSATLKKFVDDIVPITIQTFGIPAPAAAVPANAADGVDPAAALAPAADAALVAAASAPTPVPAPVDGEQADHILASAMYLEAAHVYHGYWQYKNIDDCIASAQRCLGVKVELTGVMGKRTRWQKDEKAQLVIKVVTSPERAAELTALQAAAPETPDAILAEHLPHNLAMDSDVLLEHVALAEGAVDSQPPMLIGREEQSLLLSLFENVRKTSSHHITRDEEMMGYVQRVLQESARPGGRDVNRSWALECSALYHRSVLECSDKHAQDRALQQLEELSALFDRLHAPTTVASIASLSHSKSLSDYSRSDVLRVRMRDVYLSNYPAIWNLKTGIAATFQKIGLYKSALDLFLSISAYSGVIESCMLLGKLTQAEDIIRSQLSIRPSDPKLLCLLADCTRDTSHYERAWELSHHTYPRAQRSLANFKMSRHLHAEAIPHFQLALDLNPVFPAEWYAMGWCAMQVHKYDIAAMAFSRTVAFDPEYANAWNNLAASHLHLKNKPQGFSALEQAIKFKSDSWKLWENYLITAMDLREYSKALTAFEKVVTLKANLNIQGEKEARTEAEEKSGEAGKKVIDEEILNMLCRVVLDTGRADPQAFLVNRFLQLLQTITTHVVNSSLVYACFADVYELRGDIEKTVAFREKQSRFAQDSGARWTEKIESVQDAVRAQEQLIEAYLQSGTRGNLMAGKFSLDTLISKLKKLPLVADSNEGRQCIAQLEGLQQRVATATATATATPTAAAAAAASGSAASSSMSIWR